MDQTISVDRLLNEYLLNKSLRSATEWSYRKVVRSFKEYTDKLPNEINTQTILEWRRQVLKEQNLEPRTWNNRVAHLRALFNFGIEHELLTQKRNPFGGTAVRAGVKKKKILTPQQIEFIYQFMTHRLHQEEISEQPIPRHACYPSWFWLTVLDLLRYTGMRQNQLLHLRLDDVKLHERRIHLCVEGSKSHREHTVPIISTLYVRLKIFLEHAAAAGVRPQDQLINIGHFDITKREKHKKGMGPYPIQSFFRRLSQECHFTVSPHRFRHTIATHMMRSPDRNLQVVKKLLGHVSIQSTLEYIDENVDNLREILEKELI